MYMHAQRTEAVNTGMQWMREEQAGAQADREEDEQDE